VVGVGVVVLGSVRTVVDPNPHVRTVPDQSVQMEVIQSLEKVKDVEAAVVPTNPDQNAPTTKSPPRNVKTDHSLENPNPHVLQDDPNVPRGDHNVRGNGNDHVGGSVLMVRNQNARMVNSPNVKMVVIQRREKSALKPLCNREMFF